MTLGAVALADGVHSAANTRLALEGAGIHWGSNRLRWLSSAYPPVSVGIAGMLGGAGGLGIAGGFCAGPLLQVTLERLVHRVGDVLFATLLVAGVAGTPVFWYLATQDFAPFVALCLLSLAMTGLLDFVFNHTTESGFIAGLALGAATMCDPAIFVFGVVSGGVAALIRRAEPGAEPGAGRATAAVLLFPSLFGMAGWSFLQWMFTGSAVVSITHYAPMLGRFPTGLWAALGHALFSTGKEILLTPVLFVSAYLMAARRPVSVLALVPILASLVVVQWVGVPVNLPTALLLLELLALIVVPQRPSLQAQVVLCAIAVVQAELLWGLGVHDPAVTSWLHHVI